MKFLLDQDVYFSTVQFLRSAGHDVITASEIGCSQSSDSDLLRMSRQQDRIFVTRDRDFGGLVFISGLGAGVIYLRILPSALDAVHKELDKVLALYSAEALKKAFVVVEPARHRFRKL